MDQEQVTRKAVFRLAWITWIGLSCLAGGPRAAEPPLRWRWSNPAPHGNNVLDMIRAGGEFVQVGDRGQIYTSSGLDVWIPRDSGTTRFLRAIALFNGRLVITGESGTVVYGDSFDRFQFLDLGTDDWIEDVAASPTQLVAVGDNAAIYTSGDGIQWTRQTAPFSDWLRSVAYGTPGGAGLFAAVGESGAVATSTDGRQWQALPRFTSKNLNSVAWNSGQFWTVGDEGAAFVSTTGGSWTPINSGVTNSLFTTASGLGAQVIAGDGEVRLGSAGGPWSDETSASKLLPAPVWSYFSSLADDSSILLAGQAGMTVEGFKTNATSPTFWLPVAESPRSWLWEVARLSDVYLAVGDLATVMTSVDGVSWEQEVVPDSATDSILLGVGGRPDLAVAVGNAGTVLISRNEPQTITTTNRLGELVTTVINTIGVLWEAVEPRPTTYDLQGVTALGDRLVASGAGGTILTSLDGLTWEVRPTPTTRFLSSVAAHANGFVAAGNEGTLLRSSDGLNWSPIPSGVINWLFRVRSVNGQLVAVGENGTILTSSDGVNWQNRNSGTSEWLNDISWVDGKYFVVGTKGTVLTSADLTEWTSVGTITEKALFGVAGDGERVIAVGVEGSILRAPVRLNLDPILTQYQRLGTGSVVTNSFVFFGSPDQRFVLQRSSDLENWEQGNVFEFLGNSTLLFYTESRRSPPARQYFKTTIVP